MEDRSDSNKFEDELREIYVFAFEYGKNTVGLVSPKDSREKRKKFICACHEGYGLAQEKMTENIISIEKELKELKNELKRVRRERRVEDIEKTNSRIELLNQRVVVLKKIADSLGWLFMGFEGWIIRRHYLGTEKAHLVDSNISSARKAVEQIRREPLCFALICDLTTCFQICDLIEMDFSNIEEPKITLIELKEGEMNKKVLDTLDSYSVTKCARALYIFREIEGKEALAQLTRVVKQHYRMAEVDNIVKTGKGKDFRTGREIKIPDKYYIEDNYFKEFNDMVRLCRKEKVVVKCIDDCLFVGMFDMETFKRPELIKFMFKHVIYHLLNKGERCRLDGEDNGALDEIRKIGNESYEMVDLRMGFNVPIAKPLYLWPIDKEVIFDIIFGRIVVLSYLDVDILLENASMMGLETDWTKTQPGWSDYFTRIGKRPFIKKGKEKIILGDIALVKILFEGIRPTSIVKIWCERLDDDDLRQQ